MVKVNIEDKAEIPYFVNEELENHPSHRAWLRMKGELREKYMGETVAFVKGQFMGHGPNAGDLIREVYEKTKDPDILLFQIKEQNVILRPCRKTPRKITVVEEEAYEGREGRYSLLFANSQRDSYTDSEESIGQALFWEIKYGVGPTEVTYQLVKREAPQTQDSGSVEIKK